MEIKLLGLGRFYEVTTYRGRERLEEVARAFVGSLRQHYNPNLVMLITNPLEAEHVIYEFRVDDVVHVEERPSLTRLDGVTVEVVRVWVANGSLAMKMSPFRVGD